MFDSLKTLVFGVVSNNKRPSSFAGSFGTSLTARGHMFSMISSDRSKISIMGTKTSPPQSHRSRSGMVSSCQRTDRMSWAIVTVETL